jgi:hypothetical protein
MTTYLFAFLAATLLLSGCGNRTASSSIKEAWNYRNNPQLFNITEYNFDSLPLTGLIDKEYYPWSDDYWPTFSGGISNRWQVAPSSINWKDYQYAWLTKEQILAGTAPVLIETLSPAEKYDLLLGRYDFPLAKSERERQEASVDPFTGEVPTWYGLCHGWAPATIMEPEPGAVAILTNADGVEIPFFTSDIKALLTKIYADYGGSNVSVGERCRTDSNEIELDETGRIVLTSCRDTNPGALHVILAQSLGHPDPAQRKSFVADVTRGSEVWNQAVVGFEVMETKRKPFDPATDPKARFRAPRTKELVRVTTEFAYIGEVQPHKAPMKEQGASYTHKEWLEYTLELDEDGDIIGGEWQNGSNAPDFLWRMLSKPTTTGYLDYAMVRAIADASRNN